uniref:Sugar phosphate transporter domain-containing protein n=1 Tax=Clastoptera arizonana TaxID=38151 RepID=A0A1B6ECK3_9HEMI
MNSLFSKYLQIISVVALYWFVSIVTVFINKALLSNNEVSLEAPLFIAWFQCLVSTIICFILSSLGKCYPTVFNVPSGTPLRLEVIKKLLPLSILFAAMISFNNLCLKYVGVAFYYIGRSLTTVFNVIFTYLILGQTTSFPSIMCCLIIIAGFWLGVDQENDTGDISFNTQYFRHS